MGCSGEGSPAENADRASGGDARAAAGGDFSGSGATTGTGAATGTGAGASGGSEGNGSGGDGSGSLAEACAPGTDGQFLVEDLDRGLIARIVAGGVYVGWRMLGYEYDPVEKNVAYDLFRDGEKIATVTDSTNYLDAAGSADSRYSVALVVGGIACERSADASVWSGDYLTIPLSPPATGASGGTYAPSDASVGDLDGDGALDLVLKWEPSNSKDNSQSGVTDNVFLDGYTLGGERLFRIDLGPNIRAGAHYTQFSVGDFDGDGQAEVACKTAPGTRDGSGSFLAKGPAASDDDSAVYRNGSGYVLTGPEYLTVFSGSSGAELDTIAYPVARGSVSSWGDNYGNRVDRFNGGMAFVSDGPDGAASGRPSIIQGRGYYTRLTVSAVRFAEGELTTSWVFDSSQSGNGAAAGQGNHQQMAIDVDGDGAQELITGAATIGSSGTLRCTTGMGHGDALHVGELIVGEPPAVFSVHEGTGGYDVHDAASCDFHVSVTGGVDNGRGVAEYISASLTTAAGFWSATAPSLYSAATGEVVGQKPGSTNFLVYWDADDSRELEDGTRVTEYGGGTLLSCDACASNNGTKSTPTLTADLFGDFREEVVWRESNNEALRIYTTADVTTRRLFTLMHDPTYRAQVSFEQSAYNQPPHVGFHLGEGMALPPKPDIAVVPR
jgi:hypothetical protein